MAHFSDLELHERLLKALEQLALDEPTPVQNAMIPLALAGHDLQVSAETGSGKTAAYLLPLLQRLMQEPAPNTATRALILLPTRELALQVEKHCRDLCAFTRVTSGAVVGGVPYGEQKAMIRKNPEILVGTPGRLLEHVRGRSIELKDLEVLVLDEADRMLDMGFRDEVLELVRACPTGRQTFLLSATLAHQGIGRIAEAVLREPQVVAIGSHRSQHGSIVQQRILADDPGHKQQLCNWLLAHEDYDKALVFTNTREHAEQLAVFLQSQRDGKGGSDVWHRAGKKRTRVACLHGEMPQEDRKRLMHWFRDGTVKVLVSTDLAARGLDVKGVDLVINFALARSGDDYVHRIGRTGRAGAKGLAISLIAPQEWNLMQSIERYLGITLEERGVAGLESRFKGPVKKKPGEAKKKDKGRDSKKKERDKTKERHRNKKNIGKRRKPSGTDPEPVAAAAPATAAVPAAPLDKRESQGLTPLKRKTPGAAADKPARTAKAAEPKKIIAPKKPKPTLEAGQPNASVAVDAPLKRKPKAKAKKEDGKGENQLMLPF